MDNYLDIFTHVTQNWYEYQIIYTSLSNSILTSTSCLWIITNPYVSINTLMSNLTNQNMVQSGTSNTLSSTSSQESKCNCTQLHELCICTNRLISLSDSIGDINQLRQLYKRKLQFDRTHRTPNYKNLIFTAIN